MSLLVLWALVWLGQAPAPHTGSAAADVAAVVASPAFKAAAAALDQDFDRHVAETIRLTEIPSAPFKEAARAKVYAEMFRAEGLSDVEIDAEGNVLGVRKGAGPDQAGSRPLVAIAAHLDTVFPEGTPVTVRREGTKLFAPGVGDDSRSLAVLLAIVRALNTAHVVTKADILFVGDVDEEGTGDLRGMKYLFNQGKYKGRITAFISADGTGPGDTIVTGAVGSKRYHVTFSGPGGHSYGDFGIVNPAFAMGNAIKKFSALQTPRSPKVTFNVGVMGGGTSVNSIPHDVWMDVDMRSPSKTALAKIDASFKALVTAAVAEENAARSTRNGRVSAALTLIGDRPTGTTPATSRIAAVAAASVRAFGLTPSLVASSTDANVPISLGIPAITLDAGGSSDRAHALDEWIDVAKPSALRGMQIMLATLLTLAGL